LDGLTCEYVLHWFCMPKRWCGKKAVEFSQIVLSGHYALSKMQPPVVSA